MDFPVSLSNEQIEQNFGTLMGHLNTMFPSRIEPLMAMYKDLELKVATAPASGNEYYHNSFPGGYLDHILRVLDFSFSIYENWKELGLDVSTFEVSELAFVAIHHDLGKLGFPGDDNDRYIWNESEWHRKNQGKLYDSNPNIPFALVPHLSLYLLQRYGVRLSWNEMLGIMIHDGLYEDENKAYLMSYQHKAKLRSNLPLIVHQADLMASKFEYERWAAATKNTLVNYRDEL